MIDRLPRPARIFLATASAMLTIAGVACKGLTGIPASLPTRTDSATVYAINGARAGEPTALNMFSGIVLAADATFLFDIAFDIDQNGNAVILPQRAVSSALAPSYTVGLQTSAQTFDAVTSAPRSGYRADTAVVVIPNQVVIIQASNPNLCQSSLSGTSITGKIAVTSIDRIGRQMRIRFTVNPNCGFRSFAPGVPKD